MVLAMSMVGVAVVFGSLPLYFHYRNKVCAVCVCCYVLVTRVDIVLFVCAANEGTSGVRQTIDWLTNHAWRLYQLWHTRCWVRNEVVCACVVMSH